MPQSTLAASSQVGRAGRCEWHAMRDTPPPSTGRIDSCCWSIEMSWVNCSVRMSSHEDMGDTHNEPQGSAPGRTAQGRARREDQQCPRRPGPAPQPPAVSTGEGPLRHRGGPGPAPSPAGPALAPAPAPELRAQAIALLQSPYGGLNDCHATEKLLEVEGLLLSRSSVRRLRRALRVPAKRRRRPPRGRMRRTPEAQMGALVQLDASPFAWLEDRGPALTLHGAIDDATGTGLALVFRPTEDLHGYATLLQQLCTTYGRPLALYG